MDVGVARRRTSNGLGLATTGTIDTRSVRGTYATLVWCFLLEYECNDKSTTVMAAQGVEEAQTWLAPPTYQKMLSPESTVCRATERTSFFVGKIHTINEKSRPLDHDECKLRLVPFAWDATTTTTFGSCDRISTPCSSAQCWHKAIRCLEGIASSRFSRGGGRPSQQEQNQQPECVTGGVTALVQLHQSASGTFRYDEVLGRCD